MSEHVLTIDPIGVTVDESPDAQFDDLDAAGRAALTSLISGAPGGSVWEYLDDTYLTGGATLGIPDNVGYQDDLIETPEGNSGLAWSDTSGDPYTNEASSLMALDPISGDYETVNLTTDPTNPLILVGTTATSGNVAFIAVIDPTNLTSDVYLFEYTPMFQADTGDPNDITTLGVNVTVDADLSIGDFSDAVAGQNQWNMVGKSSDPVQLLLTSDPDWDDAGGNTTINTNDFAIGSPSQDVKVNEMVRIDILAGGATSDIDLTSTETKDASALELGNGHFGTTEFTWGLIQTGGSAKNRVDTEVTVFYVDDGGQGGSESDAAFFERTIDGASRTAPDIVQVDILNASGQVVASWNTTDGQLTAGELGTAFGALANYDGAVEIGVIDNLAEINNVLVDWSIKTYSDTVMNQVEIFNDSDTVSAPGGTPKGSLGNKTFDVGAFVIGGSQADTDPLNLNFADDGPSDEGGPGPIRVFEDGLLPDGLTDMDGETDTDGDIEGTSVLDINLTLFVDGGADTIGTWGLLDDQDIIDALTLQGFSSGGVPLFYAVTQNDGADDVLTATKGEFGPPVFELKVGEDGLADYFFYLPLDTTQGVEPDPDEDEVIIPVGNFVYAQDKEGDQTTFGATALTLVHEDDAPSVSLQADTEALEVDETNLGVPDSDDFSGYFSVLYGADGPAASTPLVYTLEVGNAGVSGLTDTATGDPVTLAIEAATGDIVGTVEDGGSQEVVRINVDDLGTVTLTQSRAIVHPNDADPNDLVTFASGDVLLRATASDFDTDMDDKPKDISLLLGLRDDAPTIAADGVLPAALRVDESAFGIDDSDDFSGIFTSASGNDGEKSLTYSLELGTGAGASGLTASLSNTAVTLAKEGNDIVGRDGNDDAVVRVSVDGITGQVMLDQTLAVLHLPNGDENDVTAFAANSIDLVATILDNDNDEADAKQDISALLELEDDAPEFGPQNAVPTLQVDETNLAANDSDDFSGIFDPIPGNDGQKSLAYSLDLGSGAGASGLIDVQTDTAVVLALEGDDIVGRNGFAVEVVRVSVDDATGAVTLDQSRAVAHDPNLGVNDIETFAANSIDLVATLLDKDNDQAVDRVDISGNLQLVDDAPSPFTPESLFVFNDPSGTDTSDLDSGGNIGNDLDGTANFVNGTDGDMFSDFVTDAGIVGGLDDIFLFGFGTGTLTATTDPTGADAAQDVFEMTLDVSTDLASIDMFQAINALVNVPLDASTAVPSPGNPLVVILPDIGGSTIDARFSGWIDNTAAVTTSQTTVNIKSDGVGVGNGQDFNVDGEFADRLQLELFEDGLVTANGIYDVGEERTVNDLVFQVEQNNSPGDDADLIVRAFDASGAEVQITKILINGDALVTNGVAGAGVASNDDGGTVTASAAGLGWDLDGLGGGQGGGSNLDDNDLVLIGTDDGFFRIDLIADGRDANKDTFDILLETVAIPVPNDIDFQVDAQLVDEDGDTSPIATIDVTLDYDGIA